MADAIVPFRLFVASIYGNENFLGRQRSRPAQYLSSHMKEPNSKSALGYGHLASSCLSCVQLYGREVIRGKRTGMSSRTIGDADSLIQIAVTPSQSAFFAGEPFHKQQITRDRIPSVLHPLRDCRHPERRRAVSLSHYLQPRSKRE